MLSAVCCVVGGIAAKVAEAVKIAACGAPVIICRAGSEHALAAMKLGASAAADPNWRGTLVLEDTSV